MAPSARTGRMSRVAAVGVRVLALATALAILALARLTLATDRSLTGRGFNHLASERSLAS